MPAEVPTALPVRYESRGSFAVLYVAFFLLSGVYFGLRAGLSAGLDWLIGARVRSISPWYWASTFAVWVLAVCFVPWEEELEISDRVRYRSRWLLGARTLDDPLARFSGIYVTTSMPTFAWWGLGSRNIWLRRNGGGDIRFPVGFRLADVIVPEQIADALSKLTKLPVVPAPVLQRYGGAWFWMTAIFCAAVVAALFFGYQ